MFSPTAHVRFETEKTRFRKNNIINSFFFKVHQICVALLKGFCFR